jgi:flagellar basal-body rod modification protein FlgD
VTTPISGTTATTSTSSTSTTSSPGTSALDTGMGKDAFMKLLVAQLKDQNPMSPADGNQYMSQMAVFAQVEKLGQLVEAQQASQAWQERIWAAGLVGKQVTGTAADGTEHSAVVTGFGAADGQLQLSLADGSTMGLGDITKVEQQQL